MTRKLVIHVGAAKCASSSIQTSLEAVRQKLKNDFGYFLLTPPIAGGVEWASEQDTFLHYLDWKLSEQTARQIVISHETLGDVFNVPLVCSIADWALRNSRFDQVVISGYSRVQSSRCVSGFSQWAFREREPLTRHVEEMTRLGLPWQKFTPLERFLLDGSINLNHRSHFEYYSKLLLGLKSLGERVTVVSNHIPTEKLPFSLLRDFVTSSKLALPSLNLESMDIKDNSSFHPILVNGIASYVTSLQPHNESFFPGPHEGNNWVSHVSDRVKERQHEAEKFIQFFANDFTQRLREHIDCAWAPDNQKYCELMSVNFDYFRPSKATSQLTENEILSLANDVASRRRLEDVQEFNRLTEKISIQEFRAALLSSSPPQTGMS